MRKIKAGIQNWEMGRNLLEMQWWLDRSLKDRSVLLLSRMTMDLYQMKHHSTEMKP